MSNKISSKEFEKRIGQSPKKLLQILPQKLKILSLKMEGYAKINATTFPRVDTGRLRSSITGLQDAKDGRVRALLRAGGDTDGQPVNYANFVEFGTKYMQPRLFMQRAVQQTVDVDVSENLRDLLSISLSEEKL
jgi:HK97 gp10 family phage protein